MTARPLKKPPEKIKPICWRVVEEVEIREELKFVKADPSLYPDITI